VPPLPPPQTCPRAAQTRVSPPAVGQGARPGPDHPIPVEPDRTTGEPAPRVHVRADLEARIVRTVFYDLVEMAEERDGRLQIQSGGVWFPLGPPGAGVE